MTKDRKVSTWTNVRVPRVHTGLIVERGREVLEHLRWLGLKVPSQNRIAQAIRTVQRLNSGELVPAPGIDEVNDITLDAIRTILESLLIVYTATDVARDPVVFPQHLLRQLFKGHEREGLDTNPQFRNAQFELLVASYFLMAGRTVRFIEPPDIELDFLGEPVGVAVKRVRSLNENTLASQLTDALDQIQRRHRRGLVALNLDARTTGLSMRDGLESFGADFEGRIKSAYATVGRFAERQHLMGALVFGHSREWVFDRSTPRISWLWANHFVLLADDDAEEERTRTYFAESHAQFQATFVEVGALVEG